MSDLAGYDDALARVLNGLDGLRMTSETIGLADAAGRVLAGPVRADRALPPFPRAQMDGYALRSAEVDGTRRFPVHARVAAGTPVDGLDVPAGTCVQIATGAPVPAALDAVIPHERSDRADPVAFDLDSIAPGAAIHPRAADADADDELIAPGTILLAHHLGIAAAVGATRLTVARRPRSAVLTSGDEVVEPDRAVLPHQIRNSNGPQTLALLAAIGAEPAHHAHLPDEPDATNRAVASAVSEFDLVITVGGISAGERDHFPDAFRAANVVFVLHGAAIQPGKPVIVGRAPTGAVVLGLPGNPVSSLACMCLFGWPITRTLLGLDPAQPPWRTERLLEPVRPNPRRQAFRPAQRTPDGVRVPSWAGSGDLAHTATTDGLVRLPVQDEHVPEGAMMPFLEWPGP